MIIEGEECRFIEGTDEFYAVSVSGKVWSFINSNKNRRKVPKLLCLSTDCRGYKQHKIIYADGTKKCEKVHRLVAKAFIPNSDATKTQVNHKNEIKSDNRVENLEWMTCEENVNYGTRNRRAGDAQAGRKHHSYKWLCPLKLAYLRNVKQLSKRAIGRAFCVTHGCIDFHLKELGIK